jgi:beta-mannosidase
VRRALAPVAVWTTDEGLGGVDVHVANDGPAPLLARLRVALYRDLSQLVDEAVQEVEVGAHGGLRRNVEAVLGHFVDVSWAYRFGPPAQDLIAVSLEAPGGELIAQAFRFPAGRPITARTAAELGLEAVAERAADGSVQVRVTARRCLYGVRIAAPGFDVSDDCFGVEPGRGRVVSLRGVDDRAQTGEPAALTALNLSGRLRLSLP